MNQKANQGDVVLTGQADVRGMQIGEIHVPLSQKAGSHLRAMLEQVRDAQSFIVVHERADTWLTATTRMDAKER